MKSLGFKIKLSLISVALMPLILVSLLAYLQVGRSVLNTSRDNLSHLVFEVGVEIESTIFSAYTHMLTLQDNNIILSPESNDEKKLEEMLKVRDLYRIFEDITLIDKSGFVVISTTYDYRGEWKGKDWFMEALEGKSSISNVHIILNPMKFVISIAVPVRDASGDVSAVLAGQINMERIWEITNRVKVGKTGFIFLMDKDGNFIAHKDKDKLLRKSECEALYSSLDTPTNKKLSLVSCKKSGKIIYYSFLAGYKSYLGQGWRIGIIQDHKEVFGFMRGMSFLVIIALLMAFGVLYLLASILTKKVVKPIKRLTDAVYQVAEGFIETDVEVVSDGEIGELERIFNIMTKSLRETTVSRDELAREVRERQYIEKGLIRSRAYLSSVIKSVPVGLMIVGTNMVIRQVNQAAVQLLGYDARKEMVGQKCRGFFRVPGSDSKTLFSGEIDIDRKEGVLIDKMSEEIPILLSIVRLSIQEEEVVLIAFVDISERKKTEDERRHAYEQLQETQEKLIRSENLALVGKLSSVVAHEVKNPLTIILQGVGYIKKKISSEDKNMCLAIDNVEKAIHRADRVIRGLLDFASVREVKLDYADLNELLDNSLHMMSLDHEIGHIDVVKHYADGDLKVYVDKEKIEQVFINLFFNAIHAMPDGGKLIVSTAVYASGGKNNYLVIIEDTGSGIPEEILSKIFEPFFTTRGNEGGSGLGMAIVKSIIDMHHGAIDIENREQGGVKIIIKLN